jgi:nicotinate-nucleotide pyrophosphorylase (carboxylating)
LRDLRDDIFAGLNGVTVTAVVLADDDGVVTRVSDAVTAAADLGLSVISALADGSSVACGDEIIRIAGSPKQVAMGEERLIGMMAKPSGIASATRRFVDQAAPSLRIVSGAWKKLPMSQKEMIRNAVVAGGADPRISNDPFVYLDKNFVKMLGGVKETLTAVAGLNGYRKAIQLKGTYRDIADEAGEAVDCGADIIFVDTGEKQDVVRVAALLRELGRREQVELAFAGGVALDDIDDLKRLDLDTVDIGRAIVDAPLLDMRVEVLDTRGVAERWRRRNSTCWRRPNSESRGSSFTVRI